MEKEIVWERKSGPRSVIGSGKGLLRLGEGMKVGERGDGDGDGDVKKKRRLSRKDKDMGAEGKVEDDDGLDGEGDLGTDVA